MSRSESHRTQVEAPDEQDRSQDELNDCLKNHIESWISMLSRDNIMSLSVTLYYVLVTFNDMSQSGTADGISSIIEKSERTFREWKYDFITNKGFFWYRARKIPTARDCFASMRN